MPTSKSIHSFRQLTFIQISRLVKLCLRNRKCFLRKVFSSEESNGDMRYEEQQPDQCPPYPVRLWTASRCLSSKRRRRQPVERYNASLTSREAGSVSGRIAKNICPAQITKFDRISRITAEYKQTVVYIIRISGKSSTTSTSTAKNTFRRKHFLFRKASLTSHEICMNVKWRKKRMMIPEISFN